MLRSIVQYAYNIWNQNYYWFLSNLWDDKFYEVYINRHSRHKCVHELK